jgi:hypothetical protein
MRFAVTALPVAGVDRAKAFYLRALTAEHGRRSSRLNRPLGGLPPSDSPAAGRRADRLPSLPPRPRRQHRAGLHPPRTPTPAGTRTPQRRPPKRPPGHLEPRALPRATSAADGRRAPHRTRTPPPLRTVRARPHPRRGVGLRKPSAPSIGPPMAATASSASRSFTRRPTTPACQRSTPSPKASAAGVANCWPTSTKPQPTATSRASSTKSKSSNAAPTAPNLQRLPRPRPPSMRLTGPRERHPARTESHPLPGIALGRAEAGRARSAAKRVRGGLPPLKTRPIGRSTSCSPPSAATGGSSSATPPWRGPAF